MAERLKPEQRMNQLLYCAVMLANQNKTVRVTYAQIAIAAGVTEATVRGVFGNRDNLWGTIARDDRAQQSVRDDAAILGIN